LTVPPAKVPLAPLDGEVKVTTTPLSRLPPLSFTVTPKAVPNAVLITALCVAPAVAVTEAGAPARLVRLKLAGPTAPAVAATLYGPPAVPLAVNVEAVALPFASVVAVTTVPPLVPPAKVPLAPLDGAVNVTTTPLNGFDLLSFTVATRAEKAVPIATLWVEPLEAVMDAGVPARLVRLKLTVVRPDALAATRYGPPTVLFEVNAGAVATPLAFVVTVAVAPAPGAANAPLAPVDGAVNVTETPAMPLLLASVTVTASAANAVFTATLWEPPPEMISFEAGPARLVNEKLAFVATPATDAFTVYAPAIVFAVKAVAFATPLALVVAVTTVPPLVPPANVPLAPVEGAVNVTVAPLIGLPPLSFTVACRVANAALMATLCVAPPVATIEAAGPVVFVIL
jgi:hypothetical protein